MPERYSGIPRLAGEGDTLADLESYASAQTKKLQQLRNRVKAGKRVIPNAVNILAAINAALGGLSQVSSEVSIGLEGRDRGS